jgi:hypothetical protein
MVNPFDNYLDNNDFEKNHDNTDECIDLTSSVSKFAQRLKVQMETRLGGFEFGTYDHICLSILIGTYLKSYCEDNGYTDEPEFLNRVSRLSERFLSIDLENQTSFDEAMNEFRDIYLKLWF